MPFLLLKKKIPEAFQLQINVVRGELYVCFTRIDLYFGGKLLYAFSAEKYSFVANGRLEITAPIALQ